MRARGESGESGESLRGDKIGENGNIVKIRHVRIQWGRRCIETSDYAFNDPPLPFCILGFLPGSVFLFSFFFFLFVCVFVVFCFFVILTFLPFPRSPVSGPAKKEKPEIEPRIFKAAKYPKRPFFDQ